MLVGALNALEVLDGLAAGLGSEVLVVLNLATYLCFAAVCGAFGNKWLASTLIDRG